MKSSTISFKPLQEDDLELLCKWLDKPHVKEWWNDDLSHDEIKEKYRKRIGDITVVPFIAYLENSPIGFIQYYHADKVGDGWWADEIEGTVGIDQFIGEENYINRGYGREMICAFGQKLFENPAIKKIITDVDPANIRAIRCYEKAGLKMMGDVETPDGKAHLMVAYRNKSIEPHAYLLEKPPLGTLLYKIIPSNFFIDMLDKNYLYFRRVDTYHDDKRDSDQPNNDKELSDKSKFENAPNYSAKNYYDDCRSRTYTCCFSTENTGHIWEHYAGTDNNAVCIVFNSSKLINLVNAIFDESRLEYDGKKFKNFFYINYGLVTYGNIDNQLMDELLPNPIQYVYFKDATKYSEEKEFRISLSCIGIGKIKLPNNSYFNFPESIQLDFDLIKAINLKVIEKIYLSSNHASVLLNTISEKLKNKISADDIDRLLTPLEQL